MVISRALEHVRAGRAFEAVACLRAYEEVTFASDVACNILGLLHASLGENRAALDCFDRALRIGPRTAALLANRAVTLQRLGDLEAALRSFGEALEWGQANADLHYNRATTLHLLGRLDEALASYDAALGLQPSYPQALASRAIVLQELGKTQAALASYDMAIRAAPTDPVTFYNRGTLLRSLDRAEEALASYRRAVELRPDYTDALLACAVALHALKRFPEALVCCDQVLRIDPRNFDALFNRGNCLQELRHHAAALEAYDASLAVRPGDAGTYCNRAVTLLDLDRHEEALVSCDAALRLKPDFPEALSNRGNVLLRKLDFEGARASFNAALELRPDYVEALGNRGVALKELGLFAEAMASFDAALAIDPLFAHALNNKGALLLLLGRFVAGWEAYESRWMAENLPVNALPRTWPQWSGEPLANKRILVLDEQGLGDVIQFSRYLPLLVRAGAAVTFVCRRHMHRLLAGLAEPIQLLAEPPQGCSFDYEIPLVSLPRAFHTDLSNMENRVPYLQPDAGLVEHWRARVGAAGLRIGICWQGNPNPRADVARAVPLPFFDALAQVPGVRLISLQRHFGLEQLAGLPRTLVVEDLGKDFDAGPDAFVDAAAVMASLDLIVTCDTSIAHLAGALGRPVWVALKRVPDWRFMLEGDDMPWYPTMRLFRQSSRGDWAGVFERIAAALRREAAGEPG
jgi:tetratricopeptide (TPR) repeat protein